MDAMDRLLLNRLQEGISLERHPFRKIATEANLTESEIVQRIQALLDKGLLSRFGPMYNVDRMGGLFVLAALSVPVDEYDRVTEIVNAFPEVAHNYERSHTLNMWFVVATETREQAEHTLLRIEQATGYKVFAFPKLKEFFIGLYLPV
ncbi:MAG: AsnC family transcriptional regulator [SAR324 cluster bacterium]|nr:AsnC family transcriptional regulator [SAR324 cluster bacterium]